MPIASYVQQVAIDCPDPRGLAAFYQQICGGEIDDARSDEAWVQLSVQDGVSLGFQLDSGHIAPVWPDGPPQQAHLDFFVDDLEVGEAAVLAIGAIKTDVQPSPDQWRVFLDPAGHPFCLVND
jgi:catechol 2,3-dioxygenase-like lactoylglutathione lyase family enzyme